MTSNLKEELEIRTRNMNEADQTKLKIDVLERLIKKVEKDQNNEIEEDLERLIQQIPNTPIDTATHKPFRQSLKKVQKKAKKAFGYVERGSLKGAYVGSWIAIGIAIGAGIDFGSGSGAGIGIVFGVIMGAAIGGVEEKKAERKGLIY